MFTGYPAAYRERACELPQPPQEHRGPMEATREQETRTGGVHDTPRAEAAAQTNLRVLSEEPAAVVADSALKQDTSRTLLL